MNAPFALGKYTAAALRTRPRPDAPLLSQLLFGEPVEKLERVGNYWQVRRAEDGLLAFVHADQLLNTSESRFLRQLTAPNFVLDLFANLLGADCGLPVTFGARLPDYDGMQAVLAGGNYLYSGQALCGEVPRPDAELLVRLARKWRFCPELTGGRTPTGVDPTGLLQLLFRLVGVCLPLDLHAMAAHGRPVDFIVQCQAGDVAFFDDERGRLAHAGLLLPAAELLHVRGRVRVDGLDHYGIFDRQHRRYTHRLRIVRRYLPNDQPRTVELSRSLHDITLISRQTALF